MKKLFACLAIAALFVGCSSNPPQTPQEKSAGLLIEMQMQKKNYIKQHIPAGIGIGESADEQIALEKADQNARVDLAKSIDAQTKALINGATLNDVKVETTADGKFKVYGVMTLDTDLVSEYVKMLEEQEKKDEAEKVRAAAEKAYAELDEME